MLESIEGKTGSLFLPCCSSYLNEYVDKVKTFYPAPGLQGALWDGTFATAYSENIYLKLPVEEQALIDFDNVTVLMQEEYSKIMNGREFVFDKNPVSNIWSELDNISGANFFTELKLHHDVANLFNTLLIPEGGVGVDQTSALLLVGWYGAPPKEEGSLLVEGGNQILPETIANDIKKLGGTIELSTEVSEIVNTDSGVEIKSSDGKNFEADYVIVTTPATVASKIVKGLSVEKREALEAVKYGGCMQVGLHLQNFESYERLAACFFHNENVNAYMDQSHVYKPGETVISLNIAGEAAHAHNDDEIIQRVSEPLKKIYPDFDPEQSIADYKIKKWKDGIVRFPPGFLNKYIEALRAPEGKIFFAGDYTHNPALDGAAWSGVRAADQLLDALKR